MKAEEERLGGSEWSPPIHNRGASRESSGSRRVSASRRKRRVKGAGQVRKQDFRKCAGGEGWNYKEV